MALNRTDCRVVIRALQDRIHFFNTKIAELKQGLKLFTIEKMIYDKEHPRFFQLTDLMVEMEIDIKRYNKLILETNRIMEKVKEMKP